MPLYEYECDSCGGRFELIRKFSDPPADTCALCGEKGQVRKLISSPAFQFKGSGWYITDYARKSEGKEGKARGAEAAEKGSDNTETSSSEPAGKKSDKGAASADKSDTSGKKAAAAPAATKDSSS
jgi:putative FmdB family regulatory protein